MCFNIFKRLQHLKCKDNRAHLLIAYCLISRFKILHYLRWGASNCRPYLAAYDLWAGRGLYRAISAVTQSIGLCGLYQKTVPFIRFERHASVTEGHLFEPRTLRKGYFDWLIDWLQIVLSRFKILHSTRDVGYFYFEFYLNNILKILN